jgi:hypothetical protein
MLRRVALVRTDVSEEFRSVRRLLVTVPSFNDSCHRDERGAKLFRNVGSYKNHMA